MLKIRYSDDQLLEAGCDEAGRGCLAGPVFAAAVILPANFFHPLLNDSKKVTPANRLILRSFIEQNALAHAVSFATVEEIDQLNILNASFLAMHRALEKLNHEPQLILVDGNRFRPYKKIPHRCIVKGDGLYTSIAAASILAKTYRDEYMEKIHQQFPCYNWKQNKGYPTAEHRLMIEKEGISPHHRKTFCINYFQLSIPF
ncbi:MAG: ribonuclease HII [Bacteroidales bacterium]|nr:ribonuclease HII [Bacteroidales bacterium]